MAKASAKKDAGMHGYTGTFPKSEIDMVPDEQMGRMKMFKGSKSVTEYLRKKNAVTDTHEDFKGPWGSGTEER